MDAPDWPGFHESDTAILDYYENKRLLHEQHLASLTTYPASGFGKEHEGRELIEGKDFRLKQAETWGVYKDEYGCAMCCNGDRCDEDCKAGYKGRRKDCPYCKGTGFFKHIPSIAVPLEDKQSSQKKLITEIMEEDQNDGLYEQPEGEKQGGQDDTAFYRGDFQAYADRILRDRGASNKDVQWGINETINELKSKYTIKRKP